MPKDERLKSAYELAMERLRERDREAGVEERGPLTEEQKLRIGEARQKAKAKLAEIEIMYRDKVSEAGGDPAKLDELDERLQIDRRRVESAEETEIAEIRND